MRFLFVTVISMRSRCLLTSYNRPKGIRQVQPNEPSSNLWPVQIMLDVGVSYYSIMATYDGFRVRGEALQYFEWMADLLELWTSNAQPNSEFSNSNENSASMQLTRAINQDRLLDHIDSLKAALEDMPGDDPNSTEYVYSRLANVQDSIRRSFL